MAAFWTFSTYFVLLPGVVILLFMTLPLHTKWLRAPTQKLVEILLNIEFFGMKVLGEPLTVFHFILLLYGGLFILLLNPWGHDYGTFREDEDILRRMGRWHRERNMYISGFIFVTYLMIYQYHNLRHKYDIFKARVAELEKQQNPKKAN